MPASARVINVRKPKGVEQRSRKPDLTNGVAMRWECHCGDVSPWFTAESFANADDARAAMEASRQAHKETHALDSAGVVSVSS